MTYYGCRLYIVTQGGSWNRKMCCVLSSYIEPYSKVKQGLLVYDHILPILKNVI